MQLDQSMELPNGTYNKLENALNYCPSSLGAHIESEKLLYQYSSCFMYSNGVTQWGFKRNYDLHIKITILIIIVLILGFEEGGKLK